MGQQQAKKAPQIMIQGLTFPQGAVKQLRCAVTPTTAEINARSVRDKTRQGLLQHEMAARLGCSTSTIRDCERDKRAPQVKAVQNNFIQLWKHYFPEN